MDSINKMFLAVLVGTSLLAIGLQVPAIQTVRNDVYDAAAAADLRIIDNEITSYSQDKEKLPDSLGALSGTDELEHGIEAYTYDKKSTSEYEICATFKTETIKADSKKSSTYGSSYTDYTSHAEGKQCFPGEVTLQSAYDSDDYLSDYCDENPDLTYCQSYSEDLFN